MNTVTTHIEFSTPTPLLAFIQINRMLLLAEQFQFPFMRRGIILTFGMELNHK